MAGEAGAPPERLEARAEDRLEQLDEARAHGGEGRSRRRDGVIPGIERALVRDAGADAPQQVVALRERASEVAARAGSGRPAASGSAIEIRTAGGRRALHDRQAIGREDEDGEAGRQRVQRRRSSAVDRDAFRLTRAEAHSDLRRTPLDDGSHLDARQLLALGHETRLVGRARRPAEAAEVHGFEQATSCRRRSARRPP